MGFDAGAIIAKLELQKDQWNASIKSIQQDLKGVADKGEQEGKRITSIADLMMNKWVMGVGAITASLTALVKKTADYGDELWKTSQKTGIAVETLSGLKLAAEKSDLSIGGLAMGMSRLSRLVVEANQGGKEQAATLERIGITATDTTGRIKPMDILLGEMADKFKVMPNGVEKSAMAIDIFGKSGTEMIPLLNMGSEGLAKEREEAERLGIVMSGPAAKAGEEFNDTLTTLKKALLGVTLTIGKELLPVFTAIVQGVVGIVAKFNQWLSQNPEIIQSIRNIIESIKWLVTAIKDSIEWVGNLQVKLSGMAAIRTRIMQNAMVAEAQFEKEQREGHERWLTRHNAIMAKRQAQVAQVVEVAAKTIGEEKKVTANLADEAAKRERIIDKMYDKFVKEAADAFKKMISYSDRELKNELVDNASRTMSAAQMSQKMTNYFSTAMNNLGIKSQVAAEKVKKSFQDVATAVGQYIQIMQQGFTQFFGALSQLSNARYQKELQQMESEYQKQKEAIEKSLMSEEEKSAALTELDEQYSTNRRALEVKQAETTKRSDIAQAYMNMFAAIVASWKLGWPLGAIGAAIALAACAVQIAAIKAQPLPAMARGGFVDQPTFALVGEAGPEVVTPLPELKEMLGVGKRSRRDTPNLNITIHAFDSQDVERVTRSKIIPEIKKAMGRESFRIPAHAVG